jgi:hypothetical protein
MVGLCIFNELDKNKREKIMETLKSFGAEPVWSLERHLDEFNELDNFFWVDFISEEFNTPPIIKPYPIRPWRTVVDKIFTIDKFLEKFPFEVGDEVVYLDSNWKIIKKYWNEEIGTVEYDLKSETKEVLKKIPAENLFKKD